MVCTVGQECCINHHARKLPEIMRKNDDEPVTHTEKRVHAIAQGSFYAGWNASTLPGLTHNPLMYGIGAGIGVSAGMAYRLLSEAVSPSKVGYFKNWKCWLEYPAVMNKASKVFMSAAHTIGIGGNTTAGILVKNQYFILIEGAVTGSLASYELTGYVMDLIYPKEDSASAAPQANEKTPLKSPEGAV